MRKLAKIVNVDEVKEHPNADKLEIAIVGGWQVVVKKDEFKQDDKAVYFEIDSWVPNTIAPFLSKGKEPRKYNDVSGERLRTIKLRGELSQGLLLPLTEDISHLDEGHDLTDILGVQKWEAPISPQLQGVSKSTFPSAFPKTDQERIQNLKKEFERWKEQDLTFFVQEKIEGSSMTCYLLDGEFGVCSRKQDLLRDEKNSFWKVAIRNNIEGKMRNYFGDQNVAIQGELIGPGIQGNIYRLDHFKFVVFDIVFAEGHTYMDPMTLRGACSDLGLMLVPYRCVNIPGVMQGFSGKTKLAYFKTIQDVLDYAKGKSALFDTEREGIVFKCLENPSITFKAVSNDYLLKQE